MRRNLVLRVLFLAAALQGCAYFMPAPESASTTPEPKPVAKQPVPPLTDADFDGVHDDRDRCPGTARALSVDGQGCAVIDKVVLSGASFDTGSAVLKPTAFDLLRSVAATMTAYPDNRVELRGHSDSAGDPARNQTLSERRAWAVRNFLIKEGIDAARLAATGLGASEPVDTNDTVAGRAKNRRVAFKVIRQGPN